MTQFSTPQSTDNFTIVNDKALSPVDSKHATTVETQVEDNQREHDNVEMDVEASTTDATTSDKPKQRKRVTFDAADVVEFEPTVWTATVASDGVPVGLSSSVRRRTRRRLDSYEGERMLHRINRQEYMEYGYLEPDERLDMLEAAGHSMAIISHVERESIRVNRERWESNEYDLLYQFGLGEPAVMDLDEDDEFLLSQGTIARFNAQQIDVLQSEDDDEMLEANDDEAENPAEYYYYANRQTEAQAESAVGYEMDEMDTYDSRKYEEWAWDYSSDCILGDDDDQSSKDGFELPSLDFGLPELSSSPTDISSSGDLIVSCGKVVGLGSSSTSPSKGKLTAPTGLLV